MKTRKVGDILLVITVLAFAGYIVYTRILYPPKKVEVTYKIVKANDILKYKTEIPTEVVDTSKTSAACTNFLKRSAELNLMEYFNEIVDHQADSILKTCSGAIPDSLQAKFDDLLNKCKSSTREKITNECFGAVLSAKTASVETVIRPDVDPRDLSSTVLLHLIAGRFSNGQFFEDPERSLDFVNALLDKEPGFLGGYKVKMMLLSMSYLKDAAKYQNEFLDTLDQAKRLSPNDHDLLEMEIAETGDVFNAEGSKKNSPAYVEYLEQEAAKHPKEWLYDYYKAQAIYNNGKGNYEETVRLIEAAMRKAPKEKRLIATLENLKSDDEQRRAHPFILSIGFSLDDL